MAIRRWARADLPRIGELLGQLAAAIGEEYCPDGPALEERFASMEAGGSIYLNLVYEEAGKLLGFVSIVFYESVFHRVGTALVNELIVDESARGKGIGAVLLGEAVREARARGMDEIEVGVEKTNSKAIAFYQANGMDEEYLLLGKEFEAEAPAH
jgi:GNAT superfamily N-acetyltransferase